MHIIRHVNRCPENAKHSVMALGNFDGVHKGHQAIIKQTKNIAAQTNACTALMTFEPHPLTILKPDIPPLRLTPFKQKAQLLERLGIELLFVIHFNQRFSCITASEFVDDILVGALDVSHIVIGHDFIFGNNREGNADFLRQKAQQHDFMLTQIEPVRQNETTYSSTAIRHALKEGNITEANILLGRPFAITGKVQKGEQRGRTIGFPTANIYLKNEFRPCYGVYQVSVTLDNNNNSLPAIANFGKKPTFGSAMEMLEIYIFNFDEDIYGKTLTVEFINFIRPEQKFAEVNALIEQIKIDCEQVKRLFV